VGFVVSLTCSALQVCQDSCAQQLLSVCFKLFHHLVIYEHFTFSSLILSVCNENLELEWIVEKLGELEK
jgi:hypothetical protein